MYRHLVLYLRPRVRTSNNHQSFSICVSKTSVRESMIIVTMANVFVKLCLQSVFRSHENEKISFLMNSYHSFPFLLFLLLIFCQYIKA